MGLHPERLGEFSVESFLGLGLGGPRYRGRHRRLGREVTLVLLGPRGRFGAEDLALFEQDVRGVASLRHPRLVSLADQGVCPETQRLWVAWERLPARSAREAGRALPEALALEVVAGLAGALSAAEGQDVVHAHLDPDSVLLGDDGVARLGWLGLGRLVKLPPGSPFAAPELARGATPDRQCDLYGLGACLYLLLCGAPPPAGAGVPDPRARAPGVSQPAARLVAWLCEPRREARCPSAGALARELTARSPAARPAPAPGPEAPLRVPGPEAPTRLTATAQPEAGEGAVSAGWELGAQLTPDQSRRRRDYYYQELHLGDELHELARLAAEEEAVRRLEELPSDDPIPREVLSTSRTRRYLIKRRLGRGAQGVVYEAEVVGEQRFEGFARPVRFAALKLFKEPRAMQAELNACAVPSPGLARALDHGWLELPGLGLHPWLLLEKLQPLPSRLLDGSRALDVASAVDVFVNLLDLLHGLHFRADASLVLNDIKPDNIMLRMPSQEGLVPLDEYLQRLAGGGFEPVLVDMGCAWPRGDLALRGGRPPLVIGTPAYWAPETCPVLDEGRPRPGVYSIKSDVYALTLTFYSLLTGDLPYTYTGVHQLSGSRRLLELMQLKREHASPADYALLEARLGPDLADFEEVLALGLHPDPGSRPPPKVLLQVCRRKFALSETRVLDEAAYRFDQFLGLRLAQQRFPRIHPLYNDYTGRVADAGPSGSGCRAGLRQSGTRRVERPGSGSASGSGPGSGSGSGSGMSSGSLSGSGERPAAGSSRLGRVVTARYGRPLSVVVRDGVSGLADKNPVRREHAVLSLGKAGPQAVVEAAEALIEVLDDPESVDVRAAALRVLGSVEADAILTPLLSGLGHERATVRAETARLLSRLEAPTPQALEALRRAGRDPDRRVAARAGEALRRLERVARR